MIAGDGIVLLLKLCITYTTCIAYAVLGSMQYPTGGQMGSQSSPGIARAAAGRRAGLGTGRARHPRATARFDARADPRRCRRGRRRRGLRRAVDEPAREGTRLHDDVAVPLRRQQGHPGAVVDGPCDRPAAGDRSRPAVAGCVAGMGDGGVRGDHGSIRGGSTSASPRRRPARTTWHGSKQGLAAMGELDATRVAEVAAGDERVVLRDRPHAGRARVGGVEPRNRRPSSAT